MFPGANAQIYRNEAGEVIGWDNPSADDPYDPDDDLDDLDDSGDCDDEDEDDPDDDIGDLDGQGSDW